MPSPKNSTTLHAKLLSNIREIQARDAVSIVIAGEADEMVRPYADHLIEIPSVSTLFQPYCPRSHTRYLRRRLRRLKVTTSTSPATWPSPSPSNSPQRHLPFGGGDQIDSPRRRPFTGRVGWSTGSTMTAISALGSEFAARRQGFRA
jgi:hypothetical protein